jgi:hypothetical protein
MGDAVTRRQIRYTRKRRGDILLWIGNSRAYSILRTDTGFGESIITRVEVLAVLMCKAQCSDRETGEEGKIQAVLSASW